MKIFKFNEFVSLLEQYEKGIVPSYESSENLDLYIRGSQGNKGTSIGSMYSNVVNKQVPIYENPDNLDSFIPGCQGILSNQGNLYIAADKIFHINLIKFLQEKGKIDTDFQFKEINKEDSNNQDLVLKIDQENAQIVFGKHNIRELEKIVLLTRNENSNMLCLSPSYRKDYHMNDNKFIDSMVEMLIKFGPEFKDIKFSPQQITTEEEKARHVNLFRDFR